MKSAMRKQIIKKLEDLKNQGQLVHFKTLDIFVRTKRHPDELAKVLDKLEPIVKQALDRLKIDAKKLKGRKVEGVLQVLDEPYRQELWKSLMHRRQHGIEVETFGQLIGLILAGIYSQDQFDECLACGQKATVHNTLCNLACKSQRGQGRHDQAIMLQCHRVLQTDLAERYSDAARKNISKVNSSELRQRRFDGFARRTQETKLNYETVVNRRMSVFLDYGVFNSKYKNDPRHKERVRQMLEVYKPEELVRWEQILLQKYVPDHIEILYPEFLHKTTSYAIVRCKKHNLYARSQCRFGLEELFELHQAERTSPLALKALQAKYFGCPFCRLENLGVRKTLSQDYLITEILQRIPQDVLQNYIVYTEYRRSKATWDLGFVPLKSLQNLVDQFKVDPSIKSIDTSSLLAKLVVDIDTEHYHRSFIDYDNFLKTVQAAYEVKFKPDWPFTIVQYIATYDLFEEVASMITSILRDEALTPTQFSTHNFTIFSGQRSIASIEPVCFRHGQEACVLKPLVQLTEEGLTNLVNFVRSKIGDNVAIYLDTRFTQKFGKEAGWLEFDNDLLKTWYNFEKLSLQEAYDRHLHLGFIPVKVG